VAGWRVDPRVCEVAALATPHETSGELGSGFVIGARQVLTARHVVAPERFPATAWRVRPVGSEDWLDAELVHSSPIADLAVLELSTPHNIDALGLPLGVRWGRLASGDPVVARTAGFPDARRVRISSRGLPIRDLEDPRGELRPASAARGDQISMHLWGSTPVWADTKTSPWGGMSGAAVFVGPWLVGVIAVDPANFAGDRLKVATLGEAARDRALWAVLGVDPGELEVADQPVGLVEPYRAPRRVRQSVRLLHASYGLVPFAGREEELDRLATWCAGTDDVSALLLTGPGGQGKTRIAAELCVTMAARGWLSGFISPGATIEEIVEVFARQGPKLLVVDYADTRAQQLIDLAARSHSAVNRVRLLLLARHAGRWWKSLPNRKHSGPPAGCLVDVGFVLVEVTFLPR